VVPEDFEAVKPVGQAVRDHERGLEIGWAS